MSCFLSVWVLETRVIIMLRVIIISWLVIFFQKFAAANYQINDLLNTRMLVRKGAMGPIHLRIMKMKL